MQAKVSVANSPPQDKSHDDCHEAKAAKDDCRNQRKVIVVWQHEAFPLRCFDVLAIWMQKNLNEEEKLSS